MYIQISNYINLIYATLCVLGLFFIWVFIRTILFRNRKTKKLKITATDKMKYHQKRLFELIEIDTPSFISGDGYSKFKQKIEEQFPLLHSILQKEKVDGNAIYSYKSSKIDSPSILFATHIDYNGEHLDAYKEDNLIYGNGTFDSKSLLYTIFEAIELTLKEKGKLDLNFTLVITNDDEAKKDGLTKIINLFLKRGAFFNLVIEEGSGIIDSQVYGLRSTYALIGLGVSGKLQLRFESSNLDKLNKFIFEIKKPKFFKMKIDNKSIKVLGSIAKDMKFMDRLFLNNLFIFRRKSKKIIEEKYDEIEKMLKTNVNVQNIENVDNKYCVEVAFELSTHEKPADILIHLDDLMEKYDIDYKITNITEPSKITKTYNYGYNVVKKAISNVFKETYIAPVIVTKISEKRYFDKVSDCVIRFSPLYYDFNAFNSAKNNQPYIDCSSLELGIEFFKYVLNNYNNSKIKK